MLGGTSSLGARRQHLLDDIDHAPLKTHLEDLGAEAFDDVDGEIDVATQGDVDTSVPGSYPLTYTATDISGNAASASREVLVLQDESLSSSVSRPENPVVASFFDGQLCSADYWSEEPEILSAGLGFSDIIGLAESELTEDGRSE